MAIVPKLCYKIERDTSKIYLTDKTGVYTATNTGGYGSPNGDRSSYAGVLYAAYTDYTTGETTATITSNQVYYSDSYNNTEESSFTVTYGKDGWYKFVYSLIPTSAVTEEGNIIYNTSTDTVQIYTSGAWTSLTDYSKIDDPAQFQTVKVEKILDAKLKVAYNKLMEKYNDCYFNCNTCDCEEDLENLNKLRVFLEAAQARFDSTKQNQAQLMIERLISIYL